MNLKEAVEPVHFRELHFLPRIIFSIGAVMFIGSFFVRVPMVAFLGLPIIFLGATLNLGINSVLSWDSSRKRNASAIPWMLLSQAVFSFLIMIALTIIACHFYRHGVPSSRP